MTQLSYQCAYAQAAYPGNSPEQAGDRFLVQATRRGVLVAVIDGLGHGEKAATAALAAVDAFQQDVNRPVKAQLEHCSRSIRVTRGAAVSIAQFDAANAQLEWAGVGNVYAGVVRSQDTLKRESLLSRGGVVGFRLPTIRPSNVSIYPYDTLIMATDGIRSGFLQDAPLRQSPQMIADHIHANFKRDTDDSLVVVLRFVPA